MFRSRVVQDLISARAARQLERTHLARSQVTTGRSQPVDSNCSRKAALQKSSISTSTALQTTSISTSAGMSQPINNCSRKAALGGQEMRNTGTVISEARSVMDRLKARRERLVTLACPVASESASRKPGIKKWTSIRESIGTRSKHGENKSRPAQRPAPRVHHLRQAQPMATLAESKKSSARQELSEISGATDGRSFEFIAPMVASAMSLLRPATPQAPRAARFHGVKTQPVPFPVLVKSFKVPLKGILKKTGQHKVAAKKAVTWRKEDDMVETRVVDRWIEGMEVLADLSP
ncbi:MAG: hypothetical protein Q9220_004046 [cf. Caloplaca sp. 1 TL-2023]